MSFPWKRGVSLPFDGEGEGDFYGVSDAEACKAEAQAEVLAKLGGGIPEPPCRGMVTVAERV